MAASLGMSERTVAAVIADLRAEGYVTAHRGGRRNSYEINYEMVLKRSFFPGTTIGEFLRPLKIKIKPPSLVSG
jgi:hypothetical protein